jgi:hypothetical protein
MFFINSYRAAVDYCAPGAGCSKAIKQIYYSLLKLKGVSPNIRHGLNDQAVF